jgi:hypothetical protein
MSYLLDSFYNQLEELTSLNSWDIFSQLKPFDERLDNNIEEKIKTERKVLSIQINNGDLIPLTSTTNTKGEAISYPIIESFTPKEVDYLRNRLLETSNIWIKSRYSHLLWNITKNNQFAEIALHSYLKIIEKIVVLNFNSYYLVDIIQYIKALVLISEKTRIEKELVKNTLIKFIEAKHTPSIIKVSIIETIETSKLFKAKEIEFAISILLGLVTITEEGSYTANKLFLNLAIKIAERLKKNTSEYYIKLAENESLVISKHPDEEDFIRFTTFGEMAMYYRKGGDLENCNKYLKEYTRLKSKITLGRYQKKFTEEQTKTINEYLNDKSDILLKYPVDIIIQISNINR